MVSGSRDHTLALWKFPEDMVDDFDHSKNISYKLSQSTPSLKVINNYMEPACRVKEHQQAIRAVKIHQFTNQILTLSLDGTVKLWDSSTLKVVWKKVKKTVFFID